jgi:hypothetical protein
MHTILPLILLLLPANQDPAPRKAEPQPGAEKELALKQKALEGKAITPSEIELAIARGTVVLLGAQESLDPSVKTKAEWPYEGVYRANENGKGAVIPIGYRVGGTSIAAVALIEASNGKPQGEARAAIERALTFVLAELDLPLMDTGFLNGYDVRGWGHAYALAFLLRLREAKLVPDAAQKTVAHAIPYLVDMLAKTAIEDPGGWNYARGSDPAHASPSTFMTAPTLQILFEAAAAGEKVDVNVVEKALATLEAARLDTGAFQYGTHPGQRKSGTGFEDVPGSIGRSPVCETTLYLAGRGSVDRIRASLDAFFEHWQWIEVRRRHDKTHIPPYFIAPYYYFYAHRYAAQAIELLPQAERASYRERLTKLLWAVREEDGGWNDRVFPRSENFGTAMTLLALESPRMRPPATWTTQKEK